MPTLSSEIKGFLRRLENKLGVAEGNLRHFLSVKRTNQIESDSYFLPGRLFCLICGQIRLDKDPTGLTCGDVRCLVGISRKFEKLSEYSESLKSLAKTAGLGENTADASIVLKIEGKIEDAVTMRTALEDIARMLGLDVLENIEDLCNSIKVELENVRFLISRKQK